jgi:EF-hand domain pair
MRENRLFAWMMGTVLMAGMAAGLTVAAGAQKTGSAPPAAQQWLALMDSDNDATVSKAEYVAYVDKQFDKLDVDHDGTLDANELKLLRGLPAIGADGTVIAGKHDAKQLLLAMDQDKNGTVSKPELTAYAGMVFDALDRDHDGTLDAAELNHLGPTPKS